MASGDNVVQVLDIMPPATLYATPDFRAGGSTPAENVMVWDFDDSSTEYLDFKCKLEGYGGGGLTFTQVWSATSATTGLTDWEIGIRAFPDDAEDVDSSHTYAYNVNSVAPGSAAGEPVYDTITFTDGADMDSWAEAAVAIVRIRRNTATDTMVGDAELWALFGLET